MNQPNDITVPTETPEQLIEHISRLMAEAEAMIAGPVSEHSRGRYSEVHGRLASARQKLNEVYLSARRNVVAGARYTDETIRAYPYAALGVALAAGVVLGVAISRARAPR